MSKLKGGRHKRSGHCPKCGTWRNRLHRDHIIPTWKEGPDTPENVQDLCANCHEDKNMEDMKGKPVSKEARAKLSVATKQQWKDSEHSERLLQRLRSPEEIERRKAFATQQWAERRAKGLTGILGSSK